MRKLLFLSVFLIIACKSDHKQKQKPTAEIPQKRTAFSEVEVEELLKDDSLNVRAIEVIGKNLAFAGSNGKYGLYNSSTGKWKTNVQTYDSQKPEFRAVASTANDFFMLSAGNPALLYKTGDNGEMKLVYEENGEKVFYDSMAFWNDQEGIAMGDSMEGCLSVIITRDGGATWKKLDCAALPHAYEGEAAFAASNSNIAIVGEKTWIISGGTKSRIFFSPDKGQNWEVLALPLVEGKETTGPYSIAFYDEKNGFVIGGDYTKPEENSANKAVTSDGGQSWQLVADGEDPGYKSSVRYVPNSDAQGLVAVGFTGISYSRDGGKNWKELSKEGFYTLRFVDDSTAYAAGKGRIAKLSFR